MSREIDRQNQALAALIAVALAAVMGLFLLRGGCEDRRTAPNRNAIDIMRLSQLISNYTAEHGQPSGGNAELAKLLLDSGAIKPENVTDGLLCDERGTPYAVFLARVDGREWSYDGLVFEWQGQTVRPYLGRVAEMHLHQVVSAGRDKRFGPGGDWTPGEGPWREGEPGWDDAGSWQIEPLGFKPEK